MPERACCSSDTVDAAGCEFISVGIEQKSQTQVIENDYHLDYQWIDR